MRRIAMAGLLGAIALGVGIPVTTAMSGHGLVGEIKPGPVDAGGRVHLLLKNCGRAASGTARAGGAFAPVDLHPVGHGALAGNAMVLRDARAGDRYDVRFTCGSQTAEATMRIAADESGTAAGRPRHGTEGGVGGGAGGGLDTTRVLLGGAFLMAGATGGAMAVRRRTLEGG